MKLNIPFDQKNSKARYEIDVKVNDIETGDGVILALNREACLALSKVFDQLALGADEGFHLHLGYTEEEPQGPGWRILVTECGRI
jgi:hypothetical protein